MIEFKNDQPIKEWIVNLENQVALLKVNIECCKRQCTIVNKTTDGFKFIHDAREAAEGVKNCADMVKQYLKEN